MKYTKAIVPSKHFPSFKDQLPDLSGKTFAVTGTTSGTGRVAALTLAEKGARVLMLNRRSDRSARILSEFHTQHPNAEVYDIECDLQSFESVQTAAKKILHDYPEGLYAIINNAGIMAMPDEATADGFDVQMQTNHLSHFLLTRELYPLLQKGAEQHGDARIVNHSSVARLGIKRLEGKYLEKRGGNLGGNGTSLLLSGARWVRYSQTKLANAAFTAALHHKLTASQSKVKALVAHPGFANTELQVTTNKAGGMSGWWSLMAKYVSQSPEDGSLGILSCAALPHAQSGEFWGPGSGVMAGKGEAKPFALESNCTAQETIDLIWSKSCEAIGKPFEI